MRERVDEIEEDALVLTDALSLFVGEVDTTLLPLL